MKTIKHSYEFDEISEATMLIKTNSKKIVREYESFFLGGGGLNHEGQKIYSDERREAGWKKRETHKVLGEGLVYRQKLEAEHDNIYCYPLSTAGRNKE